MKGDERAPCQAGQGERGEGGGREESATTYHADKTREPPIKDNLDEVGVLELYIEAKTTLLISVLLSFRE